MGCDAVALRLEASRPAELIKQDSQDPTGQVLGTYRSVSCDHGVCNVGDVAVGSLEAGIRGAQIRILRHHGGCDAGDVAAGSLEAS
jgi:hypothetical protein